MTRTAVRISGLFLMLSGVAQATTLTTPAIIPSPGIALVCAVVNIGTKPLQVSVEVFGLGSADAISTAIFDLDPNQMDRQIEFADDARWCRFTFNGPKGSVRASVVTSGGGALEAY